MEALSTKPGRFRRRGLTIAGRLSRACGVLACLLVAAWFGRVGAASFVLRKVLDREDLSDAEFRLTGLSPGRLIVEGLRIGSPEPALAVDCLEARFSFAELRRGQLGRLRVRGLRMPVSVESNRVDVPLLQRLSRMTSARPDPESGEGGVRLGIGELSVSDVRVPVRLAGGGEVITLSGDVSLISEPSARGGDALPERYRVWAGLRDSAGIQGTLSGTISPQTGALAFSSDMKVKGAEGLVERVRLVAPGAVARFPAFPTNCTLALRGSFALTDWTNAGPFEVTAELGRGSAFTLKQPDGLIRFQTLRIEASGTRQDVQCRLSVGIGGFRIGGQLQASQEEGRLLSMRGTARYRQTPTNRVVRATLDSDLPSKSVAQVLPKILPLLPRLLTEGGTLHAEADVEQPLGGDWQGNVRYAAEARRNSLALPAGRVGAGRVAIEGVLRIRDASPDTLRTDIRVEEGYFFRPGASVRGSGTMSLVALPPYRSAAGTFEGKVSETAALSTSGVALPVDGIRFCGQASVDGLVTSPVWQVALEVPEFEVAARQTAATCRALAGAAAKIRYGASRFSVDADAWARGAVVTAVSSGAVGRVEAGVERLTAHLSVSDAVPADLTNALMRMTLVASNGWCRAGGRVLLENAEARVPFDWSQARGLTFDATPSLAWKRLESDGVQVLPGSLTLRTEGGCAVAAFGVTVDGSRFSASARASVPLAAPGLCTIDLAVPEAELTPDDVLAARIRRADSAVRATGRLAAEARVRFLGSQPHVRGRVRLSGGKLTRDRLEIDGLGAEVAFEAGLGFRTIERPAVTFTSAKAGNVLLDRGRVEFQVTPEEVFVDRFEVGWCKGSLNAYSVHLDPKNPKADVIVYADRIDLGEALMMVMPFKGKMEGVLYGRFPVGIDGSRVKLSTGYLYSLPGQGGVLRLEDPAQMMSLLNRAGIMGDVQQPLSKALSDMDFSAIRMELEPKAAGEAVFRIKLDGKSNFKEWPAPVALNLNLHGPLEELLNLGLSVSRK